MGQALGELLQEDAHLHPGQVLAHALVAAVAERQVVRGVVAVEVQRVRVLEVALVVVGRSHDDQQPRALRDFDAADPRVGHGKPPPRDDGAGQAQALLDGVGDERGVGADVLPRLAVLQQQAQRVGRGVGRRLVRGDHAGHHHRVQVGVGDDLGQLLLAADGVLHPAVPGRVGPHLVEHAPGELPELADRLGHRKLLAAGRPAPGVDRVGDGVLPQRGHVLLGDAEEVQRHRQRDLPQHLVGQVGFALVDEAVHVLAGEPPDHRLMVGEVLRHEGLHERAPPLHVRGLVLVHEGAAHAIAVAGQDGVRLGRVRRHLLQRDRRREGHVVAEHRFDVLVAAHDPVAELRAVEDRLLRPRPAQGLGWIDLVGSLESVERRRAGRNGAACRGRARPGAPVRRGAAEWAPAHRRPALLQDLVCHAHLPSTALAPYIAHSVTNIEHNRTLLLREAAGQSHCGPGVPRRSRLAMTSSLRPEAGWAKCDCPA